MPRKRKHEIFFIPHSRKLFDTVQNLRGPKILKIQAIQVMTKRN